MPTPTAPTSATKSEPQSQPLPALLDPNRIEYRASQKVHLTEAGEVALTNWVGKVGDKRVRVYRGAPRKSIPEAVARAYLASRCAFGLITLEELGLKSLPGGRMPRVPAPTE